MLETLLVHEPVGMAQASRRICRRISVRYRVYRRLYGRICSRIWQHVCRRVCCHVCRLFCVQIRCLVRHWWGRRRWNRGCKWRRKRRGVTKVRDRGWRSRKFGRVHKRCYCSISPQYLDIGPGSPPDWSVFMWKIELTWGSTFGRLHPFCISVLSFYRLYFGGYSFFMIARSIDPAPLPSDNESTMGPGFAVVGTSGSPSDVARTKVILPRL